MKNRILTIAVLLAAMAAMTGVAAADPYNLAIYNKAGTAEPDNPISISPGGELNLSLRMQGMVNDSDIFPISYDVSVQSGSGSPSDVSIEFHPDVLKPSGSDPYIQNDTLTVKLSPSAPVDTWYLINITAPGSKPADFGLASRYIVPIPEFATMALPVAAAIGLVFFFQNRKRKEE